VGIMTKLMKIIVAAKANKPAMGEECNHCGWCCMSEVCYLGQEATGSETIPCELLEMKEGKYYCSLADTDEAKERLGIGKGCCAKTQEEAMAEFYDCSE